MSEKKRILIVGSSNLDFVMNMYKLPEAGENIISLEGKNAELAIDKIILTPASDVMTYEQYKAKKGDNRTTLIASTASPYKFTNSVLSAVSDKKAHSEFDSVRLLSEVTNTGVPKPIAALEKAKVRFDEEIDKNDMLLAVYRALNVK